jgi:hypothetical protein
MASGGQACAIPGEKGKIEMRTAVWHRICIMSPAGKSRNEYPGSAMKLPTHELLLALRSPTSGWLATMVCALEEASLDPNFSEHHRVLIKQLLDANAVPASVASAAEERLCRFEQDVADTQTDLISAVTAHTSAAQPSRPKLTLVGSVAA